MNINIETLNGFLEQDDRKSESKPLHFEPSKTYNYYDKSVGDYNIVCDSCGCPDFNLYSETLMCIECGEMIDYATRKRIELWNIITI